MKTLDSKNFDKYSLDNFMRHQQVRECSRNVDGRWILLPMEFEGGKVVNFVKVSHNMFPDSVTKIKLRAFTGCKSLENVTI